jgi:hypothetical protein
MDVAVLVGGLVGLIGLVAALGALFGRHAGPS